MYKVILTFALFASVFTVGKVALEAIPPFLLTGIRYALAGVALLIYELFRGGAQKNPAQPHLIWILGVGLFSVFLTNGLEFWGLQYLSSGKTCLIYSICPLFSVILGYFFLGEKMSRKKLAGLLIGMIGFYILLTSQDFNDMSSDIWKINGISIAEIMVTLAAISSVFGWIFFKKLSGERGYPINLANGYSFLVGAALSFTLSYFFEPMDGVLANIGAGVIMQVIYITLVHSIICYTLYAQSLHRFSVTFMMFAGITNPMFTALYGWIFLNEAVTINFIVCLMLVALGLYLFYLEEK